MAIRYGFFNALKNVDEHGNVTYDRTYNSEDFTTYFRGLISDFGVFHKVGDRLKVSLYNENDMKVVVSSGKAVVNGYWISVDDDEYIDIPEADIVNIRKDRVVIQWSEDDREMKLYVKKGTACDYITTDDMGSVRRCTKDYPVGFDPITHTWNLETSSDPSTAEITLAYITVRPKATRIVAEDIEWVVGTEVCPYISRVAVIPDGKDELDLDMYLAWYRKAFEDWFEKVQDELQINTDIHHQTFEYSSGDPLPIVIPADFESDKIDIHFNGRHLSSDEYTLTQIDEDNVSVSFTQLTEATIPYSNDIFALTTGTKLINRIGVCITKGSPITFPDATKTKY